MALGAIVNGVCTLYDGIGSKGNDMVQNAEWEARVKGLLKAEIKRRNLTYAQLVEKLAEIDIKEEEHNLRNKIARGKFSAAFFIQCLTAIGCQNLRIGD